MNADRLASMSPERKVLRRQRISRIQRLRVSHVAFEALNTMTDHNRPTELSDLEWHTLPPSEFYRRLSTEPTRGLSAEQVCRKISEHGKNTPSPAPTHHFKDIFGYFYKGFGSILLVGSILVFVCWKPLGAGQSCPCYCLACSLLHTGCFQCVARLVVFKSHGFHHLHAACGHNRDARRSSIISQRYGHRTGRHYAD